MVVERLFFIRSNNQKVRYAQTQSFLIRKLQYRGYFAKILHKEILYQINFNGRLFTIIDKSFLIKFFLDLYRNFEHKRKVELQFVAEIVNVIIKIMKSLNVQKEKKMCSSCPTIFLPNIISTYENNIVSINYLQ